LTQDTEMLEFFGRTLQKELEFCSRIAAIHTVSKDSIKTWREKIKELKEREKLRIDKEKEKLEKAEKKLELEKKDVLSAS